MIALRPLDDADDIAAVLTVRVERYTSLRSSGGRGDASRLIVGLVPEALGPMTEEMAEALRQREQLMEDRATALAQDTVRADPSWLNELGARPTDPQAAARWERQLRIVVAYRDLYVDEADRTDMSENWQRDRDRTATAVQIARSASLPPNAPAVRSQTLGPDRSGPVLSL